MPHEGVVSRPSILILFISFFLAVDLFEGVVVEKKVGSSNSPEHPKEVKQMMRRAKQGPGEAQQSHAVKLLMVVNWLFG
jgi:hypothetical protein